MEIRSWLLVVGVWVCAVVLVFSEVRHWMEMRALEKAAVEATAEMDRQMRDADREFENAARRLKNWRY